MLDPAVDAGLDFGIGQGILAENPFPMSRSSVVHKLCVPFAVERLGSGAERGEFSVPRAGLVRDELATVLRSSADSVRAFSSAAATLLATPPARVRVHSPTASHFCCRV